MPVSVMHTTTLPSVVYDVYGKAVSWDSSGNTAPSSTTRTHSSLSSWRIMYRLAHCLSGCSPTRSAWLLSASSWCGTATATHLLASSHLQKPKCQKLSDYATYVGNLVELNDFDNCDKILLFLCFCLEYKLGRTFD